MCTRFLSRLSPFNGKFGILSRYRFSRYYHPFGMFFGLVIFYLGSDSPWRVLSLTQVWYSNI